MIDRRELGRRLFEVAGDWPDAELATALGMDQAQVKRCRAAVGAGKALPVRRTLVVERFLERAVR